LVLLCSGGPPYPKIIGPEENTSMEIIEIAKIFFEIMMEI
jgi:hypothetical protein